MRRASVRPPGALLVLSILMNGCDALVAVDEGTDTGVPYDPAGDHEALARSAQQELATAYSSLIVYSAWFTGEALVAETFSETNEFGLRLISPDNRSLETAVWTPLSVARASADRLLEALGEDADRTRGASVARVALVAGYSYLFMAELFCAGAVDGGPAIRTNGLLDLAVSRFSRAIEAGHTLITANPDAASDVLPIIHASHVGRARARLQAGQLAEAARDAATVPAAFEFRLDYSADPLYVGALGNRVWLYTFSRPSLAVAPAFRDTADPRLPVSAPRSTLTAIDGITEYWTQRKYPGFGAPIRLASKLEADYILAEASGESAMMSLIQTRRAAGAQAAYAGTGDRDALLADLMTQRSRDFFLEGKRQGDWRRHPALVADIPPGGQPYHKPGYGLIGTQVCFPMPSKEPASRD